MASKTTTRTASTKQMAQPTQRFILAHKDGRKYFFDVLTMGRRVFVTCYHRKMGKTQPMWKQEARYLWAKLIGEGFARF